MDFELEVIDTMREHTIIKVKRENMSYEIPKYTKEALDSYVKDRIPTGSFLIAVLTNDLFKAFERADDNNMTCLKEICCYIYNELPMDCYGSVEKVKEWLGH